MLYLLSSPFSEFICRCPTSLDENVQSSARVHPYTNISSHQKSVSKRIYDVRLNSLYRTICETESRDAISITKLTTVVDRNWIVDGKYSLYIYYYNDEDVAIYTYI